MQESKRSNCSYYFVQDPIFSDNPDSEERLVINSATDQPKWHKTVLACTRCDLINVYVRKLSDNVLPDDARSANVVDAFEFLRRHCPLRNTISPFLFI